VCCQLRKSDLEGPFYLLAKQADAGTADWSYI
jgi:hypothetical protein